MHRFVVFAAAFAFGAQAEAAVIFDQLGNFNSFSAAQDFEPALDNFDVHTLEDFTLNGTTKLTSVSVGGIGFNGMTSLDNVQHWQVSFFSSLTPASNTGTGDLADVIIAPGSALVTPSLSNETPSWTITLPIDVTLQQGNWFFGVRPRLNFDDGGQFGIGIFDIRDFNFSIFANPGQGFGFGTISATVGNAAYRLEGTAVTAVPEPASWAMLIAGFGLTGAVMRRHPRVVAA